jgi:hypothetical protein
MECTPLTAQNVLDYLDRIITLEREKGSYHEIPKVHPRFQKITYPATAQRSSYSFRTL